MHPRQMLSGFLSCLALLSCLADVASASPITYNVLVNTSSIAGTTGSLDFNFNPGVLITQAASVQIFSLRNGADDETTRRTFEGDGEENHLVGCGRDYRSE